VLDFGCGHEWQSIALARLGAAEVLGLEIVTSRFPEARERAREFGVGDHVRYGDNAEGFQADVVISISAFEHFSAPRLCCG
jgi:cyclopropane fatty-acyl-phospholipid synthase-like methyltransferase